MFRLYVSYLSYKVDSYLQLIEKAISKKDLFQRKVKSQIKI